MGDKSVKDVRRNNRADNGQGDDVKLPDLSSEPAYDVQDTPIASPTLEEFSPAIQVYRAETQPGLEGMTEELRSAAIFERHMSQRHLVLFQSIEEQLDYHPLPYCPLPEDTLIRDPGWRLILEMRVEVRWMRLGLDLYDRVTLGRGESRDGYVMVNLNPYGAGMMGVSRKHLALRPAEKGVVLIDLNSTNGTAVNGESIPPEVEILLPDRCDIVLSKMKLLLYVVGRLG
ncbi:MAG: FHA domain-containing protein [Anaerolineae bacterium]|nr:FHA domain-containing protein [Anaerolineae bacterium]